jgi:BirA family biotin operon repressor/biotin-[acetyl-CoA-carboxylase] ligase
LNQISLNSLFCGRNHLHFERIDSTNNEAQKLCRNGAATEGMLITAEIQENGRGYAGNRWISEAGLNVIMTLVLKPSFLPAKNQFYLNQAVTLAIYDVLSPELNAELLKIKWPNDIVYDRQKLCGILIENTLQGEFLQHSCIGIGLNVNQTVFPVELAFASSLALITGRKYEMDKMLAALCEHIEVRYLQLKNGSIAPLQEEYLTHLFRMGEWGDYIIDKKKTKGRITGLNAEGKLILEMVEGAREFGFKEIEFVM